MSALGDALDDFASKAFANKDGEFNPASDLEVDPDDLRMYLARLLLLIETEGDQTVPPVIRPHIATTVVMALGTGIYLERKRQGGTA